MQSVSDSLAIFVVREGATPAKLSLTSPVCGKATC